MDTETSQELMTRRKEIELQLRLDGQKLDALWNEARRATGRVRTELHKQIGPLREKLLKDRKDQEAARKIKTIP